MIDNISVVLIAKNAQETIEECLSSLIRFCEVVLYLNNSTDNTSNIAQKYKNVKIIEGNFIGFGQTKNKAATYAKNNWILSLDSDEILNDKLIDKIIKQNYINNSVVYILNRDNFFLGAKTSTNDFVTRIYNKTHTKFNNNKVHEKIIIKSDTTKIKLKESFKHYNITDINQTLTKLIHYTDLDSKDKKICFFGTVIAKATFAFIKKYFFKFHIINGWRGFVISITHANRRFYKYLKQFINCQNS